MLIAGVRGEDEADHLRRNAAFRAEQVERDAAVGRIEAAAGIGGEQRLLYARAKPVADVLAKQFAAPIRSIDVEIERVCDIAPDTDFLLEEIRTVFGASHARFREAAQYRARERPVIGISGAGRLPGRIALSLAEPDAGADLVARGRRQEGIAKRNRVGIPERA